MLAFVFIPISLATSVFGMNIQELNSTGQPIWVFVVTAAVTLGIAFSIWAIMYQWTKYVHAPVLPDIHILGNEYVCDPKLSFWKRLKPLCWLIFHAHFVWFWRSGILYSMLTCGTLGFTMTCQFDATGAECGCPHLVTGKELGTGDWDERWIRTHSPHAPMAYIYAHKMYRSRTGFSFTRAS